MRAINDGAFAYVCMSSYFLKNSVTTSHTPSRTSAQIHTATFKNRKEELKNKLSS